MEAQRVFVSHYSCQQYMLLKHLRKVKSIYRLCLLSGNVLGHILITSDSSQLLSPNVFSGYLSHWNTLSTVCFCENE